MAASEDASFILDLILFLRFQSQAYHKYSEISILWKLS